MQMSLRKRNQGKTLYVEKKSIWKDRASWSLLLLCVPALVGYLLFNYIPIFASITIPFRDYKFSRGIFGSEWVGLKNFGWIFNNAGVIRALRNTFLYGLWFMITSPVVRAGIALLLFEITSRKKLKFYQTVMTFPNFMSMVVVGYVTYAILSPTGGVLNQIIQTFGGEPVNVYVESGYWPVILTVVNHWKGLGMGSMMYFASLMGVDTALYEAAEIDGASRWQRMRYISIPHLIPLVCIFTILDASSLVHGSFDLFYVIPKDIGVLYETTDILDTYTYRALTSGSYSMGATVSFVQSVAGLVLVLSSNAIVKKFSPENAMF